MNNSSPVCFAPVTDYRRPLKPRVQAIKSADLKNGDVIWTRSGWVKVCKIIPTELDRVGAIWVVCRKYSELHSYSVSRNRTLYRRTDHAIA